MNPDRLIPIILTALKGANLFKVILFGSYAYGNPGPESDLDLLVVTDDSFTPGSFRERMELKINISRMLDPVRHFMPVDLIVHTLPMHQKFIELDSSFKKEIISKGKVIYEKNKQ